MSRLTTRELAVGALFTALLAAFDDCLRSTLMQMALPPLAEGETLEHAKLGVVTAAVVSTMVYAVPPAIRIEGDDSSMAWNWPAASAVSGSVSFHGPRSTANPSPSRRTCLTPARVAIAEWVELARTYSGEPMRRLMNGVLGNIAAEPNGDRPSA